MPCTGETEVRTDVAGTAPSLEAIEKQVVAQPVRLDDRPGRANGKRRRPNKNKNKKKGGKKRNRKGTTE